MHDFPRQYCHEGFGSLRVLPERREHLGFGIEPDRGSSLRQSVAAVDRREQPASANISLADAT
jgi:hypothetical protein